MITPVTKQSGFTLVELLVYIAISSLLVLSLTAHIVLTNRLENQSEVTARVAAEITHVESVLHTAVRAAGSIVSPTPGNSATELTLEMKEAGLGNAVFNHDDETLTLEDDTQSAVPLTSTTIRITEVSFSNVSREDTPGSMYYEFVYEWIDEAGEVQRATSSSAISLR